MPAASRPRPRGTSAVVTAALVAAALLLALMIASAALAAPVTGIAVLGDSLSNEYREARSLVSGRNRYLARNCVDILVTTRHLNFGPHGTWPDMRQTGYQYDYAEEGNRSADRLSQKQPANVAAPAPAGKVNLAWMTVGGNDFRDLDTPIVINSPEAA